MHCLHPNNGLHHINGNLSVYRSKMTQYVPHEGSTEGPGPNLRFHGTSYAHITRLVVQSLNAPVIFMILLK